MTQPHEACSCSRNRKCAFHTAQLKKVERVADHLHTQQKVQMGIEALREKYGKEKGHQRRG